MAAPTAFRAKLGSTLWRLVWFGVFACLLGFVWFLAWVWGFLVVFVLFVLVFVGFVVVSVFPKWMEKLVTCL